MNTKFSLKNSSEKFQRYTKKNSIITHVRANSNKGIRVRVKLLLQGYDNGLKGIRLVSDVTRDFSDIRVIQGGVDFVQHEKRRWLITVINPTNHYTKFAQLLIHNKVCRTHL